MSSLIRSRCAWVLGALGALGCGGGDASEGDCPAGGAAFRPALGPYTIAGVGELAETCGLALSAADVAGSRAVTVGANGGVSLTNASGTFPFGAAAVRCNRATLRASGALQSGPCQYTMTSIAEVTVTANDRLTVRHTETRHDFASVAGMTCRQTTPCTIAYTLTLQR